MLDLKKKEKKKDAIVKKKEKKKRYNCAIKTAVKSFYAFRLF